MSFRRSFYPVAVGIKAMAMSLTCFILFTSSAIPQDGNIHLDGFEVSPKIISTPLTTAREGSAYFYQVEISNPDRFQVEFSLETAPIGMEIDGRTGLVEWPVPSAGIHLVEVLAVDTRGRLDLQMYDISVDSLTLEIVSEPEPQAPVNSIYQYQLDVAGETEGVEYSLNAAPAGMAIDGETGLIGWVAAPTGTFPVSVRAVNAFGQSATQQFDLQVVARAPGETVQGELVGLHDGELVVRELSSNQYFRLSEDSQFSLAPFEVGQSYLFEIASLSTSKQICLMSAEQGQLPQKTGEELIIQCTAGDVTAEDLLESIDELEASEELTPAEEILASALAGNQQSDTRSREIDRAHALVLSAEDPDPDWMGTEIDGDQVIVTSPGSVHTVSGSKFNADGDIIGAIDASMLRFEIRLQRSADNIHWVPRELAEDMVFWTGNPGEFRVQVPSDLEHGRLIVGLRPDFDDPGARAIAERWSQAVIFEIWPVRPGVMEFEPSSVLFPRSGENAMAAGSAFSIEELEQHVNAEFANDNLVMPLIVESGPMLAVGDLVDYRWNGDPYGGRIIHAESRSGQTLLLLSPEWNAVYDVMAVEEDFLEKHGVLPSVIAYRIGEDIVPGFDEQYRDPVELLDADAETQGAQSSSDHSLATSGASRSSRSAGSDLFVRTCRSPASRPVIAVSNKFKLSPPEAAVSLTVSTGERVGVLSVDCSWQANPDKRFAMPLVVAGPVGIIAQKLFGTEVGVRPFGRVVLNADAEVSALLAFKASFSTKHGMKTNMPELPRTALEFDSLEGPPIQLRNRIGSNVGVAFFANALSTRGILGKLARLFTRDEIEVGVEASVSLGIGLGFSGANAAAVHQGATSQVFTDMKFCAKVGINASLLKIMRSIIGNTTVDLELFCRTFRAAIGPEAPFTFDDVQDDLEGNAVATGLIAAPQFQLIFGNDASGIVAPTDKDRFESIFDDRHDAITYDLAECPDRSSGAGVGASPDRISGDLIVCAHSLVCGKADKQIELCGTGLSVSQVTASGFAGEQVSAEGIIEALSARGLFDSIEVSISGDPLTPQVSPQQPLTLSSARPRRTLSFESQCEAEGITRGRSEIQTFVENISPGQASNIRVCRCDPGERDCDRIWGSPHLLTADGVALDYYASGDYVLARVDGQQPIEVQGRFLPGYEVSWPQALAVQVGSDVVEIHSGLFFPNSTGSHRLRLWVNGVEPVKAGQWQPFRHSRTLQLPGGGLIVLEAMIDRFKGRFSDPSRVLVLMPEDHEFSDFGVRVQSLIFGQHEAFDLRASPSIMTVSVLRGQHLSGEDTGLLGNKDDDESNELTTRTGSIIPFSDTLTWTELYARFGASWLVRPYECLFRNGCIDNPHFPTQPALLDPERRQFAEAACFGLEGWYREACIHDVGLSGSAELVQGLYQNADDLNFMADRIKRPGTDFPFLSLTPGTVEPLGNYELHHFTVERVEGQGSYMLTIRPPKNTTAVLHSNGGGSLTDGGDLRVDAVRLSCIPDPEWSELGVAWPLDGRLELWAMDPISGTAGVKLGEMPLPADRLNEYCTAIRFNVNSEFIGDASMRIENIGDEELHVQIRTEPGVGIEASALERVAVCPECEFQLDLGMQCNGGLQKLGAMDITDAAGSLLESREVICATPAGTAFPQISMDKVFQGAENVLYVSRDDGLWDLVKKQTHEPNAPQPDLYWNGKPTPFAQHAFGGNRIVQMVPGGASTGSERGGHFLALDEHGAVWVWGRNSRGQLGIPSCGLGDEGACFPGQSLTDSDIHETPVMLGLDRLPVTIRQIAAGYGYSLALDMNGNVWSWGDNSRFALGNGGSESEDRSMPMQIRSFGQVLGEPPQIDLIAAASRTGFARTVDGRLFSWGNNFNGALGTGSTQRASPFPTQIRFPEPAEQPVGVYPRSSGGMVVDSAGQLWGWGANHSKQISHFDSRSVIRSPVKIISQEDSSTRYQWAMGSSYTSYAMDFYGRLWAWGGNWWGFLGQGDFEERDGHFPVDLSGLGDANVSAGDVAGNGAVMLEDTNGRIWGWGSGSLMPNGLGAHESLPVLIQDRSDARPEVEISSFATGERLFYGSDRLETIAVVELLDQARRLQETRRISISTSGLTFALSGTNELRLPRDRWVRDAILADSRVICEAPGLVSTAFDILDENNEILASHIVESECQYPVQFKLAKALDHSEIAVQSDWQGALTILISALDGLSHEIVQEYPETICAGCATAIVIDQICPVVGRHLLVRIEIKSMDSEYSDRRELDCGRLNSRIHAFKDATFITDYRGTPMAWGKKIKLGLGDAGASLPDVVEQPLELGRSESFGGGIGELAPNSPQAHGGRIVQARDIDGRLWVWGSDRSGESGTGIHSLNNDQVPIQLESPQPVAGALADAWISSFDSTFPGAVDRRGRVWQWGSNRVGLNGNVVASDQIWPAAVDVPVPMGQFRGLSDYSLAISSDGLELWAWGGVPAWLVGPETKTSLFGPCNLDSANAPNDHCAPLLLLEAGLDGRPIRDMVAKSDIAFFLDSVGRVWQWGRTRGVNAGTQTLDQPELLDLSPLAGVRVVGIGAIKSVNAHALFLQDELGAIWAQGTTRILGTGDNESSFVEQFERILFPETAGRITEMAATEDYVLALDENHCFWAWGRVSESTAGSPFLGVAAEVFLPMPVLRQFASPGCP